jgi:hypothetical protein
MGANLPLFSRAQTGVVTEGQEQRKKSEAISSVVNTIDLDYFSTMGIPLLAGREFTQNDREGAAPVAIINDTMAGRYWPNQDPSANASSCPAKRNSVRSLASSRPQTTKRLAKRRNLASTFLCDKIILSRWFSMSGPSMIRHR